MNKRDKNIDAFFALLRAGLWEQGVRLFAFAPVAYQDIYRLASEQSVVGLIAAGLEHVEDMDIGKQELLTFLKSVVSLESRNNAMNVFINSLVEKMREREIFSMLIKGQGIAQCYPRPLWRASGDIDLFLDSDNYERAKYYLSSISSSDDNESLIDKHWETIIAGWEVELHGTLRTNVLNRMDRCICEIQKKSFEKERVRIWQNGSTAIVLPHYDDDIIYVFTHILKHYFKGGIGLRQICDWSRLLWTYRSRIDYTLLESRLRLMGIMTEWKVFAAYAVDFLGLPIEAMPLYSSASKWSRKARRMNSFIITVGNFGKNRDNSYLKKYPFFIRKTISLWRHSKDSLYQFFIFPVDSLKIWGKMLGNGLGVALNLKRNPN